MKIGILGTGDVGQAIGKGFIALGHEVKMGSRKGSHDKAVAWVKAAGAKASEGTYAEATKFGDLIVMCTLGMANEEVIKGAGAENFGGKVVIDTTNPIDFTKGMPPQLGLSGNDSGGEQVQRLLPGAKVVKAFNTVGNALMFRPELPGGPPDMFIAGNDEAAKQKVTALLKDFGWGVLDAGGIGASRYLEAMCMVWVATAAKTGQWMQAFKMLRK